MSCWWHKWSNWITVPEAVVSLYVIQRRVCSKCGLVDSRLS